MGSKSEASLPSKFTEGADIELDARLEDLHSHLDPGPAVFVGLKVPLWLRQEGSFTRTFMFRLALCHACSQLLPNPEQNGQEFPNLVWFQSLVDRSFSVL